MSIADLCHDLPVLSFAPGEVLITEGVASPRLFVLREGTVAILRDDFEINRVSERGAILGDMSVLLSVTPTATVRALTDCTAHVTEQGEAFLRSHPDIAYALARMLAQRLHGVSGYLVDLKRQFEDQDGHLGMVDDILETLLHEQTSAFEPGSDRDPGDY
jgi:CRP/FNR family cyclic AMP-dependent transcriptional regulator